MKTIFLIAPHFPPSALPPSQRARLLVKHLNDLGFYPYVFTSDPKYREEKEDSWMTELAGNKYDLIVVKTLDPKKTRKFGIGDLGLRMLKSLRNELIRKAKEIKPDFMLYLVPPWYLMLIAKHVKIKTKIPYGIDFIDPWLTVLRPGASFKQRISHQIASHFEKKATQNADIIYSVSEGINENLRTFHKLPENKPMFAIPYGVEPSDYDLELEGIKKTKLIIRYIGAVWADAYPVMECLLEAISETEKQLPLRVEFFGTSYAGEGLAKAQTNAWITKFGMTAYMTEDPLRVTYRKAVELTLSADIILLFGGMQPYYAASKLMGLVASGKPFFAFLHEESFPAKFLKDLNYKYIVTYSQKELPKTKQKELTQKISELIKEKDNFVKFDMTKPQIQKHTAFGMTKQFIEPIEILLQK